MSSNTKVYFPGLNGLRFFAAAAVIITHVELMKKYLGFHNLWINPETQIHSYAGESVAAGSINPISPVIAAAGPLGVIFFFVLSGFLITYLLFVEREKTQTIGVGKFYLRRIFRIWPLYFLVLILGFFVLPHLEWFQIPNQNQFLSDNFWGNFLCYLFILPNLAVAIFGGQSVPNIGQSWSIGVEEQFYLVWPVIIKWFKKPLHAIFTVTIILLLSKAIVLIMSRTWDYEWIEIAKKFLAMTKIECMTIGALGAWLVYHKQERLLRLIHKPVVQLTAYSGVILLIYFSPKMIQDAVHMVYGVLFLIIILNVSGNKRSLLKMENRVMNLLGKISYGIYMYHMMIVVFTIYLVAHFLDLDREVNRSIGPFGNFLIYSISILLTIGISWLSYELFEVRFIRRKAKYSKVISGDAAREQ